MNHLITLLAMSLFLNSAGYKTYRMDGDIFRCLVPSDWKVERDVDKDKLDNIYRVMFIDPLDTTTVVTIKYYSVESGKNYKDFIQRNSKTSDGKRETPNEKYEPVKNIKVSNRDGFEINRKFKEYTSIESTLSSSYWLKERIIVIPAKKGFYTITYSAKENTFHRYKNIFDNILKSFKMLY